MTKEINKVVSLLTLIADLFKRAAGTMRPPMALQTRGSAELDETERHTLNPPDTERCHVEPNFANNEVGKAGRQILISVYMGTNGRSYMGE